jgi:hypothetical protein
MSSDLLTRGVSPEPQLGPGAPPTGMRGWLTRNRTDILMVLGLVAILGVVHAGNMSSFPARFDDEGAYMSQAWAVLERFDLSHYTYWYDHPPLGWLILAAVTGLTGGFARAPYGVAAGREAMLLFHLVSVALLYVLARRLGMRRPFAALAVLIFGLSPLGVFFHRMVLLDNIAMPLLLGGLVLLLTPRRALGSQVLAASLLALSVLVRETFLLFMPFAVYLYWKNTEAPTRRYSLALTATTFFGLLLLYPAFALLRGELLPGEGHVSLFGAIAWQLFDRQGSGSILDPASPAGEILSSWLTLDPWILVLGALASLGLLVVGRLRWLAGVVLALGLMLARPGYLPVMFVVAALPFLALAIAAIFDEAWSRASTRWGEILSRTMVTIRRGVVVFAVALLLVLAGPVYRQGVLRAMTSDADAPLREAQVWLAENLEPDDIVFVDGALWLDVVLEGHPQSNVIWFYKLDSDPDVEVPGGWESIDYVVSSEVIRNSLYDLPRVEQALESSEAIAVFGRGLGRVEIRRVTS